MGNTRAKPAIYNSTTGTYTTAPPAGTTSIALKSKHIASTEPIADVEMLDEDVPEPETIPQKPGHDEERTFTVRKWTLVPVAIADKRPEPKYLADRRPGLQSLYGHAATNSANFTNSNLLLGSAYGASVESTTFAAAAGEEGISTSLVMDDASGIIMPVGAAAVEPPKRRPPPPPPKRRKKHAGTGRRRKVQVLGPRAEQTAGAIGESAEGEGAAGKEGDFSVKTEEVEDSMIKNEDGEDDEGSGSGDDEGSEEGEIDEGDATTTAGDGAVDTPVFDMPAVVEAEKVGIPEEKKEDEEAAAAPSMDDVEETKEASQAEPAVDSEAQIEETASVEANVPTEEEENTAPAADNEVDGAEQTTDPVPTEEGEKFEDGEVDLLGSLDLAVQSMEEVDAVEVPQEKPAE